MQTRSNRSSIDHEEHHTPRRIIEIVRSQPDTDCNTELTSRRLLAPISLLFHSNQDLIQGFRLPSYIEMYGLASLLWSHGALYLAVVPSCPTNRPSINDQNASNCEAIGLPAGDCLIWVRCQ